MILCGYQGIGKSSIAKCGSGFIDLESSNFWINGDRDPQWYIPYCNIAMHLSKQGHIVLLSSHEPVRRHLLTSRYQKEDIGLVFPALELKDYWLGRLEDRYRASRSEKNYKAWKGAAAMYEQNIHDMMNEPNRFHKLVLRSEDYNLSTFIKEYLNDYYQTICESDQ